jgi:hypothetical protein
VSAQGKQDFTGAITGDGFKKAMTGGKASLTLVPPTFTNGVAQVLDFGAKKYARGQWMRGMSFSAVLDGMKRHLQAIELGEDLDPESGLPHLYHLGCGAAFLSWFQYGPRAAEYARFDDRLFAPPRPAEEPEQLSLDLR